MAGPSAIDRAEDTVSCCNITIVLYLLVQGSAAFCVLPDLAGLDAIVRAEDISSSGPQDCRERVKVGDVIKGR